MKSINALLRDYHDNHSHQYNRIAHYVGVPFVAFSILILLGFVHITVPTIFDIHFAWLVTFALIALYVYLDWQLGLATGVLLIILNFLADMVSQPNPSMTGLEVFLFFFIVGLAALLVGHYYFEGKKPAFIDDAIQFLVAPLFLTAELLAVVGYKKPLEAALGKATSAPQKAKVKAEEKPKG